MGIVAILSLIAQAVPTVTTLAQTLGAFKGSAAPEAVKMVETLLPVAASLMQTFTTIKTQTETQYPEVWASVRADYEAASAAFDQLNSAGVAR